MVPGHPATTTSGPPPYVIDITTKTNGDEVVVYGTLYSTNQSVFRGFLIEEVSGYGDMSGKGNRSQTVCGANNTQGLTHVDNSEKTHVNFTWVTTNSSIWNIQFRATVVEKCCDVSRFWLNITSNKLNPSSTTPVSTNTTPAPQPTTIPPGQIKYDPKCGISKGCYSDCNSSECTFLVTWQRDDNNNFLKDIGDNETISFDIKMKLPDVNNQWVAVGISPAGKMDGTNVAACISETTGVMLQSSYNDGYSNVPFNDTTLGLTLINGEVSDGIIHCQFTRAIQLENVTQFLDLQKTYYMLVGTGPVANGLIQKHEKVPFASPDKINFMTNDVEPKMTTEPATMTTPTSSAPNGQITYDPDCGVSKGCFPDCLSTGCTYFVTWQKNAATNEKNGVDTNVIFDIKMKVDDPMNKWIAVGISPEGKMKGTNVAACLSQSSGVSLQSSHNDDYSNILYTDSLLGLKLIGSAVTNGIIHCRYSRAERMSDEPAFLDLNETYYLVVASGPITSGVIQQHTSTPYKSTSRVNFLENYVSNEDTSGPSLLIKLHASLMIVAWVFLTSVGIVAARHCRTVMVERAFFNVKAWFLIHRGAMILAVICVIVAFVVIFVEIKGFSKIAAAEGKAYTRAHPYTGIAATALGLINPLLAFARPSPTAQNRPIFNWVHFLIGNGAHLIAVITIFFGIELSSLKVHQSALYIMCAYVGVYFLIHKVLEIERRRNRSKKHKEQTLDNFDHVGKWDNQNEQTVNIDDNLGNKSLTEYGTVHRTNSSSGLLSDLKNEEEHKFPMYMLVIHAVLMAGFATLLILYVCVPSRMNQLFDR